MFCLAGLLYLHIREPWTAKICSYSCTWQLVLTVPALPSSHTKGIGLHSGSRWKRRGIWFFWPGYCFFLEGIAFDTVRDFSKAKTTCFLTSSVVTLHRDYFVFRARCLGVAVTTNLCSQLPWTICSSFYKYNSSYRTWKALTLSKMMALFWGLCHSVISSNTGAKLVLFVCWLQDRFCFFPW